jgi:hypothetical protein
MGLVVVNHCFSMNMNHHEWMLATMSLRNTAMVQESFWDFLPMAIMDINGTN